MTLNLYGNAYLGKLRENGEITRLSLLHPEKVTPEMKNGNLTFQVSTEQGIIRATEADIIHVRAMSTDGLVGLSPVAQARTALGLSRSLTDHARGTYTNGGRPGGILKVQAGGNGAADRLEASFGHKHGHPDAAGKIMVLAGDVDYTPLAMTFADAEFLESRRYSATEIARIFRVAPSIIGADTGGSSLTYSTVEGQAQAFVTFSLRPWLVLIEQAISTDRDLCPGSTYVEFKLDGLLRADTATRAQVYTAALDPETGWMTRDEVRNLENLETE